MNQAVSRQLLSAEARVRSSAESIWQLWLAKRHWNRIFLPVLLLSLPIQFRQ